MIHLPTQSDRNCRRCGVPLCRWRGETREEFASRQICRDCSERQAEIRGTYLRPLSTPRTKGIR